MPARDRRRKKRPKGAIDWNLTNIGAAISMIGFLHFILIFFLYLMTGYIGWFLAIPGIILLAVGYALIVKDYFDQKKKGKGPLTRRRSHPEEE